MSLVNNELFYGVGSILDYFITAHSDRFVFLLVGSTPKAYPKIMEILAVPGVITRLNNCAPIGGQWRGGQ